MFKFKKNLEEFTNDLDREMSQIDLVKEFKNMGIINVSEGGRMTCKYCDDLIASNLIDTQDSIEKNTLKISSPKNIMAYIDNDCLTAESFDAYANIKIKYCPMCGRKLGDGE